MTQESEINDKMFEKIRECISDAASPESIAEASIGLAAMASHRARMVSKDYQISLMQSLSSTTTSLHLDARKSK